jgi:hypothetical protein
MPDPVNDPRPLEQRVFDLQLQAEALRMDLQTARGDIAALRAIVRALVHNPSHRNRLAIAAEFNEFLADPRPVHEDGGGGK